MGGSKLSSSLITISSLDLRFPFPFFFPNRSDIPFGVFGSIDFARFGVLFFEVENETFIWSGFGFSYPFGFVLSLGPLPVL